MHVRECGVCKEMTEWLKNVVFRVCEVWDCIHCLMRFGDQGATTNQISGLM